MERKYWVEDELKVRCLMDRRSVLHWTPLLIVLFIASFNGFLNLFEKQNVITLHPIP